MLFHETSHLFNYLKYKYKRGMSVNIASYGMYLSVSKGKD
jgi:hypothetical protein